MELCEMKDLKSGDVVKLSGFREQEDYELFGIIMPFEEIKSPRKKELKGEEKNLKKCKWVKVLKEARGWTVGVEYTITDNDGTCVWEKIELLDKDEVSKFMRDLLLEAKE